MSQAYEITSIILLGGILTVLIFIWSNVSFLIENCIIVEEGEPENDD